MQIEELKQEISNMQLNYGLKFTAIEYESLKLANLTHEQTQTIQNLRMLNQNLMQKNFELSTAKKALE